jgi:hypothetical protein
MSSTNFFFCFSLWEKRRGNPMRSGLRGRPASCELGCRYHPQARRGLLLLQARAVQRLRVRASVRASYGSALA